jgi:hypothetical protein
MFDPSENQSLETALYENWQSLTQIAVVANIAPGDENWFDLLATFHLPSTTIFPMRVAVAPGGAWNRQFECFSFELVQVVPHLDYPRLKPPDCSRTRVFHYGRPVRFDTLIPLSRRIPDQPCIERVKIGQQVFLDVRGLHNVQPPQWSEKILSLLSGAWLITRDDNLLTEGELRYELEISSAIDSMAQKGHDRSNPPRFSFSAFTAHWPVRISRAHLYNLIPDFRREEIEQRYYRRWREVHKD